MKKFLCVLLAIVIVFVDTDLAVLAVELPQEEEMESSPDDVDFIDDDMLNEESMAEEEIFPAEEQEKTDEEIPSAGGQPETDEAEVSVVTEDNLSVKAANGLGNLLMDELEIAAQEEKEEIQAAYHISEIEVSGNIAEVKFFASGSCSVVVSIYEEGSNKPLAFGSALVEERENRISVPLEIEEMPVYFVVKGYLVATDSLRPLSKEYQSDMYTAMMQQFLKKGVSDFDERQVVNLDEDTTTNFVVVNESSILVRAEIDAGGNKVNEFVGYDETNSRYTFAHADESMRALKTGDIFSYWDEETNTFLFVKVGSIDIKEDASMGMIATVVASPDELSVEDVFQYIKIDEIAGNAEASEITQDMCAEGITYMGRGTASAYAFGEAEGEGSHSWAPDRFSLDLEKIFKEVNGEHVKATCNGELTLGFGVEIKVKYYFDVLHLLGYVDLAISSTVGVEGNVEVDVELSYPLISGPALEIKTSVLEINYLPEFVFKASFRGELNIVERGLTIGIRAGNINKNGFYWDYEKHSLSLDAKLEGIIGVRFNPKVAVMGYLAYAELDTGIYGGAKGKGSIIEDISGHDCGRECISGNFFLRIPLSGRVLLFQILDIDLDKQFNIDNAILAEINLGDFYYSIKYKEFGFGKCPHRGEVQVTVTVLDAEKKPVKDAAVSVNSRAGTVTTGADGTAQMEVPRGSVCFYAGYLDKDGMPHAGSVSCNVNEDFLKVPIILGKMKGTLRAGQKVADIESFPTNIAFDSYNNWVLKTENKDLYIWGNNENGVVGDGTTIRHENPVKVLEHVKDVQRDKYYRNGNVAAVTNDGRMYVWGDNSYGQLGQGKDKKELSNSTVPMQVPLPLSEKVDKIAVAYNTIAAVTLSNRLYSWGYNGYGKLGTGDTTNRNKPELIMEGVADVKISEYNTMILTTDGKVYTWGGAARGMLGDGTEKDRYKLEIEKPAFANAKSIEMGRTNIAVITNDGDLYMCGVNSYGQTGTNSTGSFNYYLAKTQNISNVARVMIFPTDWVAAITENGDLYTWGSNEEGQLGDGGTQNKTSPYKVKELKQVVDVQLSVEAYGASNIRYHTVTAVTKNQNVWQWGSISQKEVGKPQKVFQNVKYIASCARVGYFGMSDGSLWKCSWRSGKINNFIHIPLVSVSDYLPNRSMEEKSYAFTAPYKLLSLPDYGSPKTFTGLVPGELYNFYAMKSRAASAPLENGNLLNISQGMADESGTLSIDFALREDYDTPDLFVVGKTELDITKAEITVEDLVYSGMEQMVSARVIYKGEELTEGVDYILSGDYKAKDVGEYTLGIQGIGLYSGTVMKSYKVTLLQHTVTFDSDGGSAVETQVIEDGQSVAEPEPPVKENHRFVGWYLNERAYDFSSKVTQDITLTAHWEVFKPLDVPVFNPASGSIVKVGSSLALKCTDPDAVIYYTIDGSEPTKESLVYQEPITITKDTVVKAFASKEGWLDSEIVSGTYTVARLTIRFDSDGGSPVEEQQVLQGQQAAEPEPPIKEGYRFMGWYLGETLYDFAATVTEDLTLKAKWEVLSFPGTEEEYGDVLPEDIPQGGIPDGIWIAGLEEYTYTSAAITPQVRVYNHDRRLVKGKDYTISYKNNKKAKESSSGKKAPTVIVKGTGNYAGTVSRTFTINKATLTEECLVAASDYYAGSAYAPVMMLDGNILKAKTDYTITYQDREGKKLKKQPVTEGNYSMRIVGKGNCTGDFTFPYTIVKDGRISIAKGKAVVPGMVYGDKEPAVSLTVGGETLTAGSDYTVRFANTGAKGTATVTFTGTGKYTGVLKKTFKVKAAPLPGNISVASSAPYEKGGAKAEVTVTANGTKLTEGIDYTVSYKGNARLGSTAKATVKGKGNYSGSQSGSFRVTEKDLAAEGVRVYVSDAAAGKDPAVMIYDTNGKKLSSGSDYTAAVDEASHTVTITGGKNHLYTVGTPIMRTYRELEAGKAITSVSLNKKASGFPKKIQYAADGVELDKNWLTVKAGKNVLSAGDFEVIGYINNASKGTATVIIQGNGEYGGTKALNFKIQSQDILSVFR